MAFIRFISMNMENVCTNGGASVQAYASLHIDHIETRDTMPRFLMDDETAQAASFR